MDNQHRQIKGYRELSQAEIDLMNEIKTKGAELQALLSKVDSHLILQVDMARTPGAPAGEVERISAAQPQRWKSIAATHFQEGLMALTRSVAQPTFF
jgi:hypothetical protein